MKLTLAFLFALCVVVTGCTSATPTNSSSSSSSSSSSDNGKITTEKAQNALDRFVSLSGSGNIRIKGSVREMPAQNSATAELDVSNFKSKETI